MLAPNSEGPGLWLNEPPCFWDFNKTIYISGARWSKTTWCKREVRSGLVLLSHSELDTYQTLQLTLLTPSNVNLGSWPVTHCILEISSFHAIAISTLAIWDTWVSEVKKMMLLYLHWWLIPSVKKIGGSSSIMRQKKRKNRFLGTLYVTSEIQWYKLVELYRNSKTQ